MSHCLLHAMPIRIAIQLKIPMVLLGENSAYEYSGSSSYNDKFMSEKYFNYYVSNSGHTPKKFSKRFNIPYKLMKPYDLPSQKELKKHYQFLLATFLNGAQKII